MIHKRLPVGATLPQGRALELDSMVAHSSALQRIRNSKQQQSSQPEPSNTKEGHTSPKGSKTETTKAESGANCLLRCCKQEEICFLQEVLHALLPATDSDYLGQQKTRWCGWLRPPPNSNQIPVRAQVTRWWARTSFHLAQLAVSRTQQHFIWKGRWFLLFLLIFSVSLFFWILILYTQICIQSFWTEYTDALVQFWAPEYKKKN